MRRSGSIVPSLLSATALLGGAGDVAAGNLLRNSAFEESGAPFLATFVAPAVGTSKVSGGELCVTLTAAGLEPWDATVRQRALGLKKGHVYALSFKARATRTTRLRAKLGLIGPPYDVHWTQDVTLGPTTQTVTASVTMPVDDPEGELAFQMAGPLANLAGGPLDVCLSDISLDDPTFTPPQPPPKTIVPKVIVDPLGYFASAKKRAIVKSASKAPLSWQLVDGSGAVLTSGKTTVFGDDPSSGESLHQLDFSKRVINGTDLQLVVGADKSAKFAIGAPQGSLRYDALSFFYQQRSGVPIEASLVGEKWARKAGHPGDVKVPCSPASDCDAMDVHGGWYDAGDHGKYVVNGGLSTWMLVGYYERTKTFGGALAELGDGKLKIPESKNGLPDLLDEARFELEFLMRMQIPAGKPLAGMAHHKVQDETWSKIPTAPDKDELKRTVHAPSTAATLNLAAATAQCARVYKPFDAAFAAQCLTAAERAYAAAKANPSKYASPTDSVGGGAYEDADVTDEFYWAAAELFVTTGKAEYRDALTSSKHWKSVPSGPGGPSAAFTWQTTQALGTITLAMAPNTLPKSDVDAARAAVVAAADQYLKVIESEGYRTPLRHGPYPWGSNSLVLDDGVILALAFDFTRDAKYLEGVRDAMSYVLGRNPLAQTYVTGYGANPLRNPHHRFWANQADPSFPTPPPGAVSGGPNSGLEDPYARGLVLGCAPEKCFVDHIESYSTNEVAINWNAPLVWLSFFLDERAAEPAKVK